MSKLRIAYIARAYPPTVGGMENFALQLREHLNAYTDITPIINHGGKKALPAFLPYATLRASYLARTGRVDAVHLADALLAPVGAATKAATGVVVTSSVCGLDVTYANAAYQAVVPRALRSLDAVMPISRATESAVFARCGSDIASEVIPLGINPLPDPVAGRVEIEALLQRLGARRVVITVGRLIERKGHAWFAREVLPLLAADVMYLIVGVGPERPAIEAAAAGSGVADRVVFAGHLSDEGLAAARARADVFVMPNIPVAGDMEGFGLVALEASASGLPVVAANLEGITEAVHAGGNGLLVAPRDRDGFAATLMKLLDRSDTERRAIGDGGAAYTRQNFGWDATARRYADVIGRIGAARSPDASRRRVRDAA